MRVLLSSSFLAWALALARTLGACGGFGLCASLCETTSQINSAYFKRMPPPLRVLSYCYSQFVITQKLHDGAAGAWLWHPRTADQGTARVFSSRTTERTEQSREKVRPVRAVMQRAVFCGRSCTLSSCVCFSAVYCTRTRGPVRNRTEPEVPLLCGGPVRPEHAGSFDAKEPVGAEPEVPWLGAELVGFFGSVCFTVRGVLGLSWGGEASCGAVVVEWACLAREDERGKEWSAGKGPTAHSDLRICHKKPPLSPAPRPSSIAA